VGERRHLLTGREERKETTFTRKTSVNIDENTDNLVCENRQRETIAYQNCLTR